MRSAPQLFKIGIPLQELLHDGAQADADIGPATAEPSIAILLLFPALYNILFCLKRGKEIFFILPCAILSNACGFCQADVV